VIQEPYRSDVGLEYVIRGNSVILKCGIPPFIADFVSVISWQDDAGNVFPSMSTQSTHDGICKLDHMCMMYIKRICVIQFKLLYTTTKSFTPYRTSGYHSLFFTIYRTNT